MSIPMLIIFNECCTPLLTKTSFFCQNDQIGTRMLLFKMEGEICTKIYDKLENCLGLCNKF